MTQFSKSGQAFLLLLTLGCSGGKFEEGSGTAVLASPESDDLVEEPVPTEPEDVPAPIPVDILVEEMPTRSTEVQKNPLFAECASEPDRMIVADLYQLAPDTPKLPDYSLLKAIKKICLAQLDIKVRRFSEGFPGVADLFEWFSLDTRFIVNVPQDGLYTFKLVADDGANLYIANQLVIDNDGLHPAQEKTGTVELKAGDANFQVSYFQGPRFEIALELMWKGPNDTEFTYIPRALMKRPLN
ncbi:PA14 domain-containing protein [Oligoflexus tunisiensis]|uniref:PA14 domain-containing protein n=1 Tax=Oligoflexus tunisiensis TaxID=708132 RepID=UPI00114CB95D|nr:PA14 domain-containing protein [Oligoflexus tunisiensis]